MEDEPNHEEKKSKKFQKKINRKHPEFELTYDMMLGIRFTVSKAENSVPRDLRPEDYLASENLRFPKKGSTFTPAHEMRNFKFKDYCPEVFRHIRERFDVNPVEYLLSICGQFGFLEFISNSKSGEFFFYSHDHRFMIKTISKGESKIFRKMLPAYYKHVKNNPNTLLTKYFGMHRVKPHKRQQTHFLIMGSVFWSPLYIYRTYDLKGSRQGRSATAEEKKQPFGCVFKDNDYLEQNVKISIGPTRAQLLNEQIASDVEFLKSLNVMDYSLLFGIHRTDIPDHEIAVINEEQRQKAREETNMRTKMGRKKTKYKQEVQKRRASLDGTKNKLTTAPKTAAGDGAAPAPGEHEIVRRPTVGLSLPMADVPAEPEDAIRVPSSTDISSNLEDGAQKGLSIKVTSEVGEIKRESKQSSAILATKENPATDSGHKRSSSMTHQSQKQTPFLRSLTVRQGAGGGGSDVFHRQSVFGVPAGYDVFSSPGDVEFSLPPQTDTDMEQVQRQYTENKQNKGDIGSAVEPVVSLFTREHGGIAGQNSDGTPNNEVYFMGIIDILTEYTMKKKMETIGKGLKYKKADISSVSPAMYASRFKDFMRAGIK